MKLKYSLFGAEIPFSLSVKNDVLFLLVILLTHFYLKRYHSLAPMYYRGAQAAIVVYDLTSKDSFERAKTWVKELQRQGSPNIVIALSGNKLDLANKRQVDVAEAQAYADENGLLFYETSAKTSANVNELFVAIGKF